MSWGQGGCSPSYCNKHGHSWDFCNNCLCHNLVRLLEKNDVKDCARHLLFSHLLRLVRTFKKKISHLLHGLSDWWKTAITTNMIKQTDLVSQQGSVYPLSDFLHRPKCEADSCITGRLAQGAHILTGYSYVSTLPTFSNLILKDQRDKISNKQH